jgi:hypothetical protein
METVQSAASRGPVLNKAKKSINQFPLFKKFTVRLRSQITNQAEYKQVLVLRGFVNIFDLRLVVSLLFITCIGRIEDKSITKLLFCVFF